MRYTRIRIKTIVTHVQIRSSSRSNALLSCIGLDVAQRQRSYLGMSHCHIYSNSTIGGREFFVGISQWTNEAGARAVAAAFPEYPCTPIKVKPETLALGDLNKGLVKVAEAKHLKSYVTMGGPDLLCVGIGKEAQEVVKRMEREATFSYQTLTLPEDEAANVLYLNGTLVHLSIEEIPLSFKFCHKFRSTDQNGSNHMAIGRAAIKPHLYLSLSMGIHEQVKQHVSKFLTEDLILKYIGYDEVD